MKTFVAACHRTCITAARPASHAWMAALLMAVIASAVHAQQALVPAQNEIVFTSKQMGVPVDGRFKKFSASVVFDPKQPAAANIAFSIDLTSAQIGDAETLAELARPGWFDSQRVPQATFQSSGVKAGGPGKFEVSGKLTIKGIARELVVPVSLTQAAGATVAAGAFVIKRLDFKIGDGDWSDTSLVANDVQVKFKLALTGVGPL